jgi:hypothetical protein
MWGGRGGSPLFNFGLGSSSSAVQEDGGGGRRRWLVRQMAQGGDDDVSTVLDSDSDSEALIIRPALGPISAYRPPSPTPSPARGEEEEEEVGEEDGEEEGASPDAPAAASAGAGGGAGGGLKRPRGSKKPPPRPVWTAGEDARLLSAMRRQGGVPTGEPQTRGGGTSPAALYWGAVVAAAATSRSARACFQRWNIYLRGGERAPARGAEEEEEEEEEEGEKEEERAYGKWSARELRALAAFLRPFPLPLPGNPVTPANEPFWRRAAAAVQRAMGGGPARSFESCYRKSVARAAEEAKGSVAGRGGGEVGEGAGAATPTKSALWSPSQDALLARAMGKLPQWPGGKGAREWVAISEKLSAAGPSRTVASVYLRACAQRLQRGASAAAAAKEEEEEEEEEEEGAGAGAACRREWSLVEMRALEQVVRAVGPPLGEPRRNKAAAAAWGRVAAEVEGRSGEGLRSASAVFRKWVRG